MNTSASPLTPFDIVVAQAEALTGESLHERLRELCALVPEIEGYTDPKELLLSVGAMLADRPPVRRSYLEREFPRSLAKSFSNIVRGAQRAVAILEEERVYSGKFLPSQNSIAVLVATWAKCDVNLDEQGNLSTVSKRYLWSAWLTQRYEKTASTRSFIDYRQIVEFIESGASIDSIEIFNRNAFPLPSVDDILAASWPARADRLARAIIAISARRGAFDFADGGELSSKNIASREYHHIFPRAFLGTAYPESQVNRAVNCALLSMPTNRHIGAKNPASYLSERAERSDLGEDEIHRRVTSHCIEFDSFISDDFDRFCLARAKFISEMAEKLAQ